MKIKLKNFDFYTIIYCGLWLLVAMGFVVVCGTKVSEDTTGLREIITVRVYNVDVEEYISLCRYSWLKYALLFSPIATCGLIFFDRLFLVDKKRRIEALIIALLMAVWRIIGESYFNARSWELITGAKIVALVQLIGYFGIFYLIVKGIFYALDKEVYKYTCQKSYNKLFSHSIVRFLLIWFFLLWSWWFRLRAMAPVYCDTDTFQILSDAYAGVDVTSYPFKFAIMSLVVKVAGVIGLSNTLFLYMTLIYLASTLLYAWMLFYFREKGISSIGWHIVAIYVALVPRVQEDIFYVSKDAQESMFILLSAFLIYLWLCDRPKSFKGKFVLLIGLVLSLILVFLERKSGIVYVAIIIASVLLIELAKKGDIRKVIKGIGLITGMLVLYIVASMYISRYSSNEFRETPIYKICFYPVKYYSSRLTIVARGPILDRAGIDYYINEMPNGYEDDVAELSAQTSYTSVSGGSNGVRYKHENLVRYIIQNDKNVAIQAWLNLLYGYMDVGRQTTSYSPVLNYTTLWSAYAEPRDQKELLELEADYDNNYPKFKALLHQYDLLRNPTLTGNIDEEQTNNLLGWISNIGVCFWLSVIAFVILLSRSWSKIIPLLMIDIVCLMGCLLSSFGTRPRMCAPFCLIMPLLIFASLFKNNENYAQEIN